VNFDQEFWSYVDKTGGPDRLKWEIDDPWLGDGSPCWIWLRGIRQGYGIVKGTGRDFPTHQYTFQAHRVAWVLENGPIPPDLFVMNWCDHRTCCNPAHLYLGNRKDHALKFMARGHQGYRLHPENVPRGSRNSHAKLTEKEVREIRQLKRTGVQQAELAKRFKATQDCISRICRRITWRHLNDV
jgi:hypothetical protein